MIAWPLIWNELCARLVARRRWSGEAELVDRVRAYTWWTQEEVDQLLEEIRAL